MASQKHAPRIPTAELSTTIIKDPTVGLGVVMHKARGFTTSEGKEEKYLLVKKVRSLITPDGDSTVTTTSDVTVPLSFDTKGGLIHLPYAPGVIAPANTKAGDVIPAGTVLAQVSLSCLRRTPQIMPNS